AALTTRLLASDGTPGVSQRRTISRRCDRTICKMSKSPTVDIQVRIGWKPSPRIGPTRRCKFILAGAARRMKRVYRQGQLPKRQAHLFAFPHFRRTTTDVRQTNTLETEMN